MFIDLVNVIFTFDNEKYTKHFDWLFIDIVKVVFTINKSIISNKHFGLGN